MNSNTEEVPVEKRFKRWIYELSKSGKFRMASDRTEYEVKETGQLIRVTKKPEPQRVRRRLYGKIRKATGLTWSQFDRQSRLQKQAV